MAECAEKVEGNGERVSTSLPNFRCLMPSVLTPGLDCPGAGKEEEEEESGGREERGEGTCLGCALWVPSQCECTFAAGCCHLTAVQQQATLQAKVTETLVGCPLSRSLPSSSPALVLSEDLGDTTELGSLKVEFDAGK